MRRGGADAASIADRLARVDGLDPAERTALVAEIDALFTAHHDHVYAVCLRYAGTPEHAMDLAQETLLTAYQKLATFRGDAKFSTWLVRIARYKCLNALRKHGETLTEDGVIEVEDPDGSALVHLRRMEREDLLHAAAEAVLNGVEQEVVYLRYTEQLPLDRIDHLVAIDMASGARGVLQRCKRKLGREIRRRLAELGHGSSFVRGTL